MKITAIRHGPFSPVNGGRPTPMALEKFLRLLNTGHFHFNVVACSSVPRTKELAIRAAPQHRLIIIKEFNPLETTKWPSIFGGWLYELLHRWQIFNHLMLILWWNGFPIFTEGPIEFLERTKKGLQILQKMAQTDDTLLICHQETIIALMILDGKRPFDALKKRIPHFYTYDFFTTD